MNGIAVLVSLAAIGVDYGWQPSADGQLEYIVQIEPALLQDMKNGQEIVSEILPEARNVRRFRIRVGSGPVPRISLLQNGTTPRSLVTPNGASPGSGASGHGGTSVMPPPNNWGASSRSPAHGASGAAGGQITLPPPPLLGSDGKASVLVQPGNNPAFSTSAAGNPAPGNPALGNSVVPPGSSGHTHTSAPGGSGSRSVLPPPPAGHSHDPSSFTPSTTPKSGALNLAPPPGVSSGGGWPSTNTTLPRNSPTSNITLPPPPGTAPASPPSGIGAPLPSNIPAVRPVPPPSINSGTPAPIRFGQTEIKPPATESATTHDTTHSVATQSPAGTRPVETDLLAAGDKPTLSKKEATELAPAKPWLPLVLTSLALFASLAANAYLGWVALGIYRRYRDMVDQLHQAQAAV